MPGEGKCHLLTRDLRLAAAEEDLPPPILTLVGAGASQRLSPCDWCVGARVPSPPPLVRPGHSCGSFTLRQASEAVRGGLRVVAEACEPSLPALIGAEPVRQPHYSELPSGPRWSLAAGESRMGEAAEC